MTRLYQALTYIILFGNAHSQIRQRNWICEYRNNKAAAHLDLVKLWVNTSSAEQQQLFLGELKLQVLFIEFCPVQFKTCGAHFSRSHTYGKMNPIRPFLQSGHGKPYTHHVHFALYQSIASASGTWQRKSYFYMLQNGGTGSPLTLGQWKVYTSSAAEWKKKTFHLAQ